MSADSRQFFGPPLPFHVHFTPTGSLWIDIGARPRRFARTKTVGEILDSLAK